MVLISFFRFLGLFFLDFVSGCDVEPPVDLDKNDSSDDGLSSFWPENEKKYITKHIYLKKTMWFF
jgi:hypothetical protein